MNRISSYSQTLPVDLLSAAQAPSYAKAMTRTVNISEAKTNLSKLADDVVLGEEIIIFRSGKPTMKLAPLSSEEVTEYTTRRGNWILGRYAEEFKDFDWDEWDRLDEEMHKIWRKFGYMD
jgi:antitoxin (DNA-binding transcriptional repressor) of toxin-antitoxin stability system